MVGSSPREQKKPLPRGFLRELQHLARLDLVGVAELIAIGFEDAHVLIPVAQRLLSDLAECIAGFHGVGLT